MTPAKYRPVQPVHRPGSSLLTVQEVADELRVSRMTVYRLIHSEEIAGQRIGRSIRVSEKALDDYMRGTGTEWAAEA